MNKAEKIMTSVAYGVSTALLAIGVAEVSHDFNPAAEQQAYVDTCAPHLHDKAEKGSAYIPEDCDSNLQDFASHSIMVGANIVTTYDWKSRKDFIATYTPGKNYNIKQLASYAEAGTFWGGLALTGTAGALFLYGPGSSPKPSAPSAPKPVNTVSRREYRRRYSKHANAMPLDNLTNGELRLRAAEFREKQQQPPTS